MAKTIQEQITELENKCEKFEELNKLYEKSIKIEFGMSAQKLHKLIDTNDKETIEFANKIKSFFSLQPASEMDKFITIFCNETSLQYFERNKKNLLQEINE